MGFIPTPTPLLLCYCQCIRQLGHAISAVCDKVKNSIMSNTACQRCLIFTKKYIPESQYTNTTTPTQCIHSLLYWNLYLASALSIWPRLTRLTLAVCDVCISFHSKLRWSRTWHVPLSQFQRLEILLVDLFSHCSFSWKMACC